MSQDLSAGNLRFVDVPGTDAILKIEKKKNKNKKHVAVVYPISKTELTEHSFPQALFNGAAMSAVMGLWLTFFTTISVVALPLIIIGAIPVFTMFSKMINNFLITKKDFTVGGRDEDKPIYSDPMGMPVFEFDEKIFEKSSLEIINEYSSKYQEYIYETTGKNIPLKVEEMMNQAKEGNIYGYDNSFSKVFYGESEELDEDKNDNNSEDNVSKDPVISGRSASDEVDEVLATLHSAKKKSDDEMMTKLLNEDNIPVENQISITDKRSHQNTSYFNS